MQTIKINNSSSLKGWRDQSYGLEGYYELTMGKNKVYVLKVDKVISSSFFLLLGSL